MSQYVSNKNCHRQIYIFNWKTIGYVFILNFIIQRIKTILFLITLFPNDIFKRSKMGFHIRHNEVITLLLDYFILPAGNRYWQV